MRILVDMDDVLTDLLDPWIDSLNKRFNGNLQRSDIYTWNMEECVFPKLNISAEENVNLYEELYNSEFWKKNKPIPGAVESLKRLNDKHEILIVTASHYASFTSKIEECLIKYFPFLSYKQIVCMYDKYLIDANILIDDNYKNIEKFTIHNKNSIGLLMDAPYNKDKESELVKATDICNIVKTINTIYTKNKCKNRKFYVNNWNEIETFINYIAAYGTYDII